MDSFQIKIQFKTDWRVIQIGFNADFKPMPVREAKVLLTKAGIDIILHLSCT
jgi:hypothetical protein